jgi:arylformamidase
MSDAPVYRDLDQATLDRAYDQRAWSENAAELIARFGAASAAARAARPYHADLAYGAGADERIDIFPSGTEGAPIHVHIHGGAWRALGKHDASFAAPAFTTAGINYAAPDFTNLPAVRIPDMVDQLCRALAFIHREARAFGADPDRILLSGHSSGAHLAAVLLTVDWTTYGLPVNLVKGAVLVAGLYDMEPVLLSSRRTYVHLDPAEAERLSPILHVVTIRCPVVVAYGGRESPEFVRQAEAFAGALWTARRDVTLLVEPELNHFEVAEELGRPGSAIYEAALAQALARGV